MGEQVINTPVLKGVKELGATVPGRGFWYGPPPPGNEYAQLTTGLLVRVLRRLRELP